ncbi:MAG: hypothetical protein HN580_08780 [Deltaproteobacteria bacterium]|mgnify:FL=1|jgi:hypothetical protein|nr:hypothetical protein [Deltaproteobacteria bacterium]MBT4264314.1 hypothetical protein [Deltaproteobacteria bacterium]MBT4641087.1 hypothetical protein [Deltaproteobacteria bacterium]MBT6499720.1 hypothetical protein [Deltaproteobacteria bacterium]MBT7154471.1 hypothetical protein [Deltaproteobacteria bacterium]
MELKKVRLGQQESEYDFWKDKSYLERLNMVEKLRRQFVTDIEKSKVYEIKKVRIK